MKKLITALALAGAISHIGAGSALAATPAPYPAPSIGTTVTSTVTTPGGTIVLTVARGFQPGETVRVTVTANGVARAVGGNVNGGGASRTVPVKLAAPTQVVPESFTLVANAEGGFSTPVTLGTAEGDYTITALGLTSGFSVSQTATVEASAGVQPAAAEANANAGSGLADTGADSGLVLWTLVGAGALAVGATSVVVARRRAKNESAA